MENQPKLNSSKEVIAFLAERFPQCFSAEGEARPLKIGIFQDLVERVGGEMNLSKTQLRAALRLYTSSWRYLYGVKAGAIRVDLDGNPCGELEEQHIVAVVQQVQVTVKNLCREGVVEIKLTVMRAGKARRHALAYRRVLRLFFQHGDLICAGYVINSECMACYCQQARKRGDFKKCVHAWPGLRFRTPGVLRVQSLTYQKSAVHERHLW